MSFISYFISQKWSTRLFVMVTLCMVLSLTAVVPAYAYNDCGAPGHGATHPSIDIGCKGEGNSITDATFAIIRFLTNGVGVVLVASMIYGGIMYITSKSDPSSTAKAVNRIRANVVALLVFIFAYALLNYIIPGQVFK